MNQASDVAGIVWVSYLEFLTFLSIHHQFFQGSCKDSGNFHQPVPFRSLSPSDLPGLWFIPRFGKWQKQLL